VLEESGYGRNGEMVGFDVKAMRTQAAARSFQHLANSKEIFLKLVEIVRSLDASQISELRRTRDYEVLEMYVVRQLMGG